MDRKKPRRDLAERGSSLRRLGAREHRAMDHLRTDITPTPLKMLRYNAMAQWRWCPVREGKMGDWNTVYEDEGEDDEDGDEGPVVRVTVASIQDVEQNEGGQELVAGAEPEDSSMTLEPDPFEDLEEELIELGFSPKAAAWIVSKVPV